MLHRIKNFGIVLRLVEIKDADFILSLRTNPELNKYLSPTSNDIKEQVIWLKNYKERESNQQEYYFIAEDTQNNKYGTVRLSNFTDISFEYGSWLFSKKSPENMALKADLAIREMAFSEGNFKQCTFVVRKKNKLVNRYHLGFKPKLIKEDDLNYYYSLSYTNFEKQKNKLIKIFELVNINK